MKTLTTLLALAAAAAAVPAAAAPAFKIGIEQAGVYGVTFEDLAAAWPGLEPPASAGLGVTHAGGPVPVWIEDGGDGVFGPGDRLELVAEELRGETTWFHRYSRVNVYRLETAGERPLRMRAAVEPPAADARPAADPAWTVRRHLEQDRLRLRFAATGQDQEIWYWSKLTHIDAAPFEVPLDLDELDAGSPRRVRLDLAFRGWSSPLRKPRPEIPDHRVEVVAGDAVVATATWNGQEAYRLEVPELARGALADGGVGLRIPERVFGRHALIDVAMLDWVEVRYPRTARLVGGQQLLELAAESRGDGDGVRHLTTRNGAGVVVYGGGTRIAADAMRRQSLEDGTAHLFRAADEERIWAVVDGALRSPASIELDRPSDLARQDRQADYLMIAHPRLLRAIEPLAELHRGRGLTVEVVDVEEVYDEFNAGIVHPRAIRDFLRHAWETWEKPAPRFVLLVGDASWDPRSDRPDDSDYADWTYRKREVTEFPKNRSTPYEDGGGHRDLIPAWGFGTFQGLAASDNWFVRLDGPDHHPEMAIGRLPVVEPEEVTAIVDKLVAYGSSPPPGPWRRRVLWIANEEPLIQARSDLLAKSVEGSGFESLKIYPRSDEPTNERHNASLRQAFDDGQLLVHFHGHGGRYIWRTGPADLDKKHDLFTLDDVERLAPNDRLPVVLSMTCYSGPFDHPTADSIAEKLLRVPGRGAVAVLAASWRNSPSIQLSRNLVEELTRPGATIGEAVVRAKRKLRTATEIELYNLLGDPALPVAPPPLDVAQRPHGHGGP
jgi:hypothetical protein